jgi:hypothetical protein
MLHKFNNFAIYWGYSITVNRLTQILANYDFVETGLELKLH